MGTYRLNESYDSNYEKGPDYSGPFPASAANDQSPKRQFLGLPVRSPIGVAAGLLVNSKWIETYARLGFDILTYKTVRSSHRDCYPLPNWVRIQLDGPLPPDPNAVLHPQEDVESDPEQATWAVCFGMPSKAPEVWRPDVARAKSSLLPGQLLNVSVVGTPDGSNSLEALADDYARCASWAVESGADLIEANFSCPNVCSAEGQIYHDLDASRYIATVIRQAIGSTPLLIKAGYIADQKQLGDFLECLSSTADCVVLVNAIQRPVLTQDGQPVFGKFERVGILGRAIHDDCVRMVTQATEVAAQRQLPIKVAGVGGVATAEDAKQFLDAGAEVVFLGSAPMVKPLLAQEIKKALFGS